MKKFIALLLCLIALLFGATFVLLTFAAKKPSGWLVSHENVRGSALFHDKMPYTLNDDQQKIFIDLLNHSSKTRSAPSFQPSSSIEKMEIYLFKGKDIVLVPNDESSYLLLSEQEKTFIKVHAPHKLSQLIETSYDS